MRQIKCEVCIPRQHLRSHKKGFQLVELTHEGVDGIEEALHV